METEFLETAVEAARHAGHILQEWAGKFTVREKSPANVVTEADFAAQDAIHGFIHARFPDHNFLGEEGLSENNSDSPYRWVIDPLDGTANYVHHFPYYCVSIGLERAGEMVVGVIFDPNRDEMFTALRGGGAMANGRTIRPTNVDNLRKAMVVASLPVGATREDPAVEMFLRVLPRVHTIQRTGSAALNLAYVACGRIDAFWSVSLLPWDMAAGALIVSEAAGRVSRLNGEPWCLQGPEVLSSNGSSLHEQLRELLS